MTSPRLIFCGALCALLCAPATVSAQPAPRLQDLSPAQQDQLLKDLETARAHYEAGRFTLAMELFEDVYTLFPHPDVLFRIAECQQKMGRPAAAAASYRAFLEQSPTVQDRQTILDTIDALEQQVQEQAPSALIVRSQPAGASVFLDGSLRGITPLSVELAPGAFTLEVRAPGHQPAQKAISLRRGNTLDLNFTLTPLPKDAAASSQPEQAPVKAWVLTGVGITALVSAGALTGLARVNALKIKDYESERGQRPRPADYNDLVTQRRALLGGAGAGAVVGLASLAGAGLIFIRHDQQDPSALMLSPALGARQLGAALTLTF